jgi:hypothetical protein
MSTLKHVSGRKHSFQKLNYHREEQCWMLLLLTQTVFFGEIHEFLQLSWIGLFVQNQSFPNLKMIILRKYSFQKQIQFSKGNNLLDDTPSNTDGFLWRDTVFFQLTQIGLFGANRVCLHLQTPKLQEILLSRANSILTGKQCARCSCF